jgi:hypothetical protein
MKLLPLLALFSLGCASRGVSLGSEESCVLDEKLAVAESNPGSAPLPTCATLGQNRLVNDGFESPRLGTVSDCPTSFCQVAVARVPGWRTTGDSQQIELWTDGYEDVPSGEAAQFAELDADTPDTLYQDIVLTPSELVYWAVLHRGRSGMENIEVFLGPPEAPASQGVFTSSTDDWQLHSGIYRLVDGEDVTRFALTSRSGTTEGNLVDAAVLAPIEIAR